MPGPSFARVGVAILTSSTEKTGHTQGHKHSDSHIYVRGSAHRLVYCLFSSLSFHPPLLHPLSFPSLPRFFPPSLSRWLISSATPPCSDCSRGARTKEGGIRGYGQCAPSGRRRPRGVQGPSRKAFWRPRPPPPCPLLPCPCDDTPSLLLTVCPQVFSASSSNSSSSPTGSQAWGGFQAFAGNQGSNSSSSVIAQHGCGGERQCVCSSN